jgi:hypothetical protein
MPNLVIACTEYSEHDGWYLQREPVRGDTVFWYILMGAVSAALRAWVPDVIP